MPFKQGAVHTRQDRVSKAKPRFRLEFAYRKFRHISFAKASQGHEYATTITAALVRLPVNGQLVNIGRSWTGLDYDEHEGLRRDDEPLNDRRSTLSGSGAEIR